MVSSRRVVLRSAVAIGTMGVTFGVAACGTAGGAGQAAKPGAIPKQVVLSKTQSSPFKEQAWADTFNQAQKSTGVNITVTVEPGDGYWDKRQAEFAAGTANADIIYNQPNWVLGGALAGMFADLMPLFKRDKVDLSQYYKADMDSWTWKGKLYGFPFQIEGETVFYNKQMLTVKGVPFPKADWSTDDLLQAAQRVNDPANNHFGILIENQTIQYSVGTFIRLFGGQVFTEARDKALYGDDANALKGFQYEADLPTKYQVVPTADATKTLPTGTRAMEGRLVAMAIGDISRHQDIRNALGADSLDFAPTPKGPSGARSARVYSNDWSILSLSKAQDAAWKVLEWTHSKEGLAGPQLQAIGWPPVKWASQTPQWIEPFKNTHVADAQKLWDINGHNQAVLPEGAQALTIANDALARALRGEVTARDALKESADKLNQLFSQRPATWK